MSEMPSLRPPASTRGIGLGVYFLAGPVVICLAGIGGHFGEKSGGGPGYWSGCYIAAIAAAVVAGLLFSRLFRGHPLYWASGTLGMLVGGHLTWFVLGGKVNEAPASGSDQFLIGMASLAGLALGLAAASAVVSRLGAARTGRHRAAEDPGHGPVLS